jgi:hypothetical protein
MTAPPTSPRLRLVIALTWCYLLAAVLVPWTRRLWPRD